MKCPACVNNLTEITAGDIHIDICKGGCGGVWFDEGEIKKFDEEAELAADVIFKTETTGSRKTDGKSLRKCPRCPDQVIVRQFYDPKNQVEINQCWHCSGIWLDRGELSTIRTQFKTSQDRAAAIDGYADQCMEQHLAAIKHAGKEALAEYHEETSNRYKSFLYGFKKLLGKE